jgi:hypothetical protein
MGIKPAIPAGFFCSGAIAVKNEYQSMENVGKIEKTTPRFRTS